MLFTLNKLNDNNRAVVGDSLLENAVNSGRLSHVVLLVMNSNAMLSVCVTERERERERET